MTVYKYSPLTPAAYASRSPRRRSPSRGRSRSRSRSPYLPDLSPQHLNKKSNLGGVSYNNLAIIFFVFAVLMTWFSFVESQKTDEEIALRYGDGNMNALVKWSGTTWGRTLTIALWILVLVIVVPAAKPIRDTLF